MNLKAATNKKLDYTKERLDDLTDCLEEHKGLSKDAIHYIREEIKKAKINITYYEEILKILGI